MTLRELITYITERGCFNKTAAFIHSVNDEWSRKPFSNVHKAYKNVLDELYDLPGSDELAGYTINIDEAIDNDSNYPYIYLSNDEEKFAIDLIDWNDVIDLKIVDTISVDLTCRLGVILYELTFWGFTRRSILDQIEELEHISTEVIHLSAFLQDYDVD